MAKIEVTTCDGCGVPTPAGHQRSIFTAADGWYRLIGRPGGVAGDIDACSDECLCVAVSKFTGWTFRDETGEVVGGVDPLEELFTAPAAVKSRAPRKPRPPRNG